MNTILKPGLLASLALSITFQAGCNAPVDSTDDQDTDNEENVAVAEGALMEGADLEQFFADRHGSKPVLSVGRDPGTALVMTCPPGKELDAGLCYWPCPSGYNPAGPFCWQGLNAVERGLGTLTELGCPAGKENDAGLCYPACPAGYDGIGPVCHLDKIDSGTAAAALYDPALAQAAMEARRARTFGVGLEVAAGMTGGVETGVYYGENGEYGYYTSTCFGATTDVSMEVYFTFGDFDNLAAVTGDGFDLSAGTGIGAVGFSESLALDSSGRVVGTAQQVSIGLGVMPISLGVSSCDTALHPVYNAPAVSLPSRGGRTLYSVAPNGDLQRSHLTTSGSFDVIYQPFAWGWGAMKNVSAVDGGHIYAVDPQGDLRYYHHNSAGVMDNWGTVIGQGWGGFTRVFAARFGEIYAIDGSGQLYLYEHDAALGFYSGQVLTGGFAGYTKVFSGGHKAIYAVDSSGNLFYWYFGDSAWIQAMLIGTGWGAFVSLGSTGNGEIFGVTADADVLVSRHDVDKEWMFTDVQVGWGFGFGTSGIIAGSF
jgi:Tachylectin